MTGIGLGIGMGNFGGLSLAGGDPIAIPSSPETPGNPILTPGEEQALITLTAVGKGSENISSYEIQYRVSPSGEYISQQGSWVNPASGDTLEVTVGNLTGGLSYDFRYRLANSVGNSDWSEIGTVAIASAPSFSVPDRPDAPLLEATEPFTLDVTMKATNNGGTPITNYAIQYREAPAGSLTLVNGVWDNPQPLDQLAFSIGELTADTEYAVQYRLSNSVGNSQWSNFSNRVVEGIEYPLTISGLRLFLDSTDPTTLPVSGDVPQWSDKSGNNNHAVQTVVADRYQTALATLNGLNVLTAQGANSRFVLPSSLYGIPNAANTVIIVARAPNANNFILLDGKVPTNLLRWQIEPRFGNTLRVRNGGASTLDGSLTYGTNFRMYALRRSASTQQSISNEGILATATTAGNITLESLGIGNGMDLALVLIYNRSLIVSEIAGLQSYIQEKFNITQTLVT